MKTPTSYNTISVKIFNSFNNVTLASESFFSPAPGSTFDESTVPLSCSGKSFLLEHANGQKVVFDLGIRKDVSTMAKYFRDRIENGDIKIDFGPDVAETLSADMDLQDINAVVWSHSHFDHCGNPSTFPTSTKLVVGPGTQKNCRPGFPLNEKASIPESDFLGREVVEIEFSEDAITINDMKSYDYFGDGSFYLLDAPGHCIGHMLGLARTTPTTFLLIGADAAHHPAMLRPSPAFPLPSDLESKVPSPLKNCARDAPFIAEPAKDRSIHHDHAAAMETLKKVLVFDADPDVFVVLSHDNSMDGEDLRGGGIVPWYPATANEWKAKGVKEAVRWKFLEHNNPTHRWS